MCCDACEPKMDYMTPQIHTGIFNHYEKGVEFVKELSVLINKYNIDTKLNMHDFIIAEMIKNNLATLYNSVDKVNKLKEGINKESLDKILEDIIKNPYKEKK